MNMSKIQLLIKRKIMPLTMAMILLGLAVFGGAWLIIESPLEKCVNFAVSPILLDRNGNLYHARLSTDDEWLMPVPLNKTGRWLPLVAVGVEDKRFYEHHGVDPLALARALKQNLTNGRTVSGASTITVQVVRLGQPRPRTLGSKFVEFIQALKLEQELSKEEILEIYLNRVSFGGNIRGVDAAARMYFNKSASDLSLGESALLVAILRGPSLYRPDRSPEEAQTRRDLILDSLAAKGLITKQQLDLAKAEKITGRRTDIPRRAWHFSEKILSANHGRNWQWSNINLRFGLNTSLDLDAQQALEQRLRQALGPFPERVTGAGAILDNKDQTIIAYVGHARHNQDLAGAWVDCADAPRSPGSALKPFIYLEAFENKALNLASLLADTPFNLSGQAPRNFDEYYRGPVTAQAALAESLNVPAVRVLRLSGTEKSLALLRGLGFSWLNKSGAYYGDSLAIGGCEVTLLQLLKAYATLANGGQVVTPSAVKRPQPVGPPRQLFSRGASWMIGEALKDESRLKAVQQVNRQGLSLSPAAFKTGTSYGLRDAWLAAYNPNFAMVLWLGDPAGQGHDGLVALEALSWPAQTLMSDLEIIMGPSPWYVRPENEVAPFKACLISGEPAGPYCPGHRDSFRLVKNIKTHPCRMHIKDGEEFKTIWPPELAGFMSFRHGRTPSSYIKIISPLPKSRIVMASPDEKTKMPLRGEGLRGDAYWFLDGEFLVTQPSGQTPLWALTPGPHQLTVIDDSGRQAQSDFEVIVLKQSIKQNKPLAVLTFE